MEQESEEALRKLAEKLSLTIDVLRTVAKGSINSTRRITYKPCRPWMSREIAQESYAAQKLQQWSQTLLFPNTCDADISNAGFSLSHQLLMLVVLPESI